MFISTSMTRTVITIDANADISAAQNKMTTHDIRHLPVIGADRRVIGIVTDRDIRSALPSSYFDDEAGEDKKKRLGNIKIKDIMAESPVTVSPSDTIQDALLLIQKRRFGALPVVDEKGQLKGIISVRDLLRAFINVLGIGTPGTLLCIIVEEKIGQMKQIVDAITAENISFGSILVARYWDEGKRAVFPYLLTQNIGPIKRKLQTLGFTLLDPLEWHMDHTPD